MCPLQTVKRLLEWQKKKSLIKDACDPHFFIKVLISVPYPNPYLDTPHFSTGTTTVLADFGPTDKARCDWISTKKGPLKHANHGCCEIADFYGCTHTSNHTFNLLVDG